MISDTEAGTRLALEEDLGRQAQRMAQLAVGSAELSAAVTKRTRLAAELTATHKQVATLTADYEALKARIYDALIDGTETDLAAAAASIMASNSLRETCVGKLQHLTEKRMGAANIEALKAEKVVKTLALDLKIIEGRIHNSQLLLAAAPAAEVGGDITIKSAVAQRLGLEEAQLASDLEQASLALQNEIEQQQKIRDARASRGGPVSYVNPS